ncbi:RagB/SusD family nutrient uptake outer membrane protein [Pedobacter cryophilus]|uniref:RagB/SusD family nutrient uptake outer membrane protein n=1 Tax=Pedobacter cryophilus TaxID=2571271 RepID=A0A4U1BZ48_9SPHI|nr:RagB/SusD family nutrient uptake outer membrane protein [Pedobacter cryophilus]TKB97791.1 RagB/SusD family nutrient uptake outer membrane protein [Pedobacter cryophilus]
MKQIIKNKSFLITMLLSGVLLGSCKKELESQKPQASLDASIAFNSANNIRAGINAVYSGLQSVNYYGLRYQVMADLGADNLSHVGTFPSFAQISNKSILTDNAEVTNMYNSIYSAINIANLVIAAVPNISDPTLVNDNALAELRTLRALMYFDLLRYWGGSKNGYGKADGVGVSLKLTPTSSLTEAAPIARSTEAQVYTAILADLDFAIGVSTFANKQSSVNRIGKDYANSLKARIQLYRGQYAEAEALSTAVITSARYPMVSTANYGTMWSAKNSSESIFELEFNSADQSQLAFFYYTTTLGGRNEISSSTALNDVHEVGDVRKSINYSTVAPLAKTRKITRIATGDDNVILLRSAELYLIRAEARLRKATPDIIGGLADLNVVRERAGLTPLISLSSTVILDAILAERRVELAHEGHRLFDLRRYDKTGTALGISEPFRNLWPIPQREVLTSGNIIVQNDLY